MHNGLSLYLDVLRFVLALAVFILHATYRGYTTPGWMWWAPGYGGPAVLGFFVLSGFVIAHVVTGRETSGREFFAARVGRLYSVIVPSLILTAIVVPWGYAVAPEFYHTVRTDLTPDQPLRYALTLLLIQDFSILEVFFGGYSERIDYSPTTIGGLWSLSYEVAYYMMFGCAVFLRGLPRIAAVAIVALCAGPVIIGQLPIWLLGCAVYRWRDRWPLPRSAAMFLFCSSVVGILAMGAPRFNSVATWLGSSDCAWGFVFGLNIWAASQMADLAQAALSWCTWLVRWLGALTFPLYLVHGPVFHLVGAYYYGRPIGAAGTWFLVFAGIAASVGVTWVSEPLRVRIRDAVRRLLAPRPVSAT